jgi:hypothetical protein
LDATHVWVIELTVFAMVFAGNHVQDCDDLVSRLHNELHPSQPRALPSSQVSVGCIKPSPQTDVDGFIKAKEAKVVSPLKANLPAPQATVRLYDRDFQLS